MATRERPGDRGRRLARSGLARVIADFREARVAASLSLREVGAAVGVSHSHVARFEAGQLRAPTVEFVGGCCSVVGLDLVIKAYPGGDALRDRAHAGLLTRLHVVVHPSLEWLTEVGFPNVGDSRAWDAVIRGRGWRANVEAEMRITDGQALARKLALKQRDGGPGLLILLVADTRANRDALVTFRPYVRELLPYDTREILAALRAGREPPGNGIVVL